MERLTFEGNFCDIALCQEVRYGSFCEDGSCTQRKVWERLKKYEDAGMTLERIEELADADKDGRVLIMPVKTGDFVYCLQDYFNDSNMKTEKKVKRRTVDFVQSAPDLFECDGMIYKFRDIDKRVFLTREEAEAALKAMEVSE